MQTIYLDISNKGVVPTVYAKQGDVGRKFQVVLTDSGLPYSPASGSAFSVWYSGASGEGNYTDIGEKSAFSLNGNKVEVEMIVQMLSAHGDGILCLTLNSHDGNQISSWNIPYFCEMVPGAESENAVDYYTAFSKAVSELPYPDKTLTIPGKSADASATGFALSQKAPAGYGLGEYLGSGVALTDADKATRSGRYKIDSNTANGVNASSVLIVDGFSSIHCRQIAIAASSGVVLERKCISGAWADAWDYVNPAMVNGVEYRTTERYEGKVVYAKHFSHTTTEAIGNINNSVDYNIPHGISNFDKPVRCNARLSNNFPLPTFGNNGGNLSVCKVDTSNVILRLYKYSINNTFYFDIYYTKTT